MKIDMKEKIPFYNIVNMFFVGAVFSLCLLVLLHSYIPFEWIKENSDLLSDWSVIISTVLLITMYEIGFVINRMGSVIVAPIYEGKKRKKFKIWPKDDYRIDVSEIAKSNPRFQSLITELNLMRSHIMMSAILFVIALILKKWIWAGSFLIVIVIFTLGGRKHNSKINIIRRDYAQRKNEEKKKAEEINEYFANN